MDDSQIKEYFKATFNAVADGYDGSPTRFFPACAAQAVSLLELTGDEHVLDVATGTGWVAIEAAKQLPRGHVTGIDISDGMLAQATRKVAEENIDNITLSEMDMTKLDFPSDHFDAAVSAFSIFFIEDMETQLMHVASKVKPDGTIITTSFFDTAFSPLVTLFIDRIESYGIEVPNLAWKRVATTDQCIALFNSAGLKHVTCHQHDHGYYFRDATDWWYLIWNAGFRGLVSQLSEEDLIKFKQEHLAEVDKLATDNGIWLELNILFTVGKK